MKRYYLKVPYSNRKYYPGTPTIEWQEEIVRDLTRSGRRLTLERMPPNQLGDRLGLHGERFHVVAGRDRDRFDTLCVIHLDGADRNPPRRLTLRLECEVVLWPGGMPEYRDPVGPLFGGELPENAPEKSVETDTAGAQPSPLLISLLQQLEPAVCARFRPVSMPTEPSEATSFLGALSTIWRKRRLDRYLTPSPRHESLLKGLVRPPNLGRRERDELLQLFGFELMNQIAVEHRGDPSKLTGVLEDLSLLSLLPIVRAGLWTAMLSGLSAADVREELFTCAEGLTRMAVTGIPAEQVWEDGLLRALRSVGDRTHDQAIVNLVLAAEATDDPIGHVASWVHALPFATGATVRATTSAGATERVPEVAELQEQPAPTVGEVEPAETWALQTLVPEPTVLQGVVQYSGELIEAGKLLGQSIGSVTGLIKLHGHLESLKSRASSLLDLLPTAEQSRQELDRSRTAFERILGLVGASAADLIKENQAGIADVNEVCSVLDNLDTVRRSPEWLWVDDAVPEAFDPNSASIHDIAARIFAPERRRYMSKLLALLEQLSEPMALGWLDPPQQGQDVEEHLRTWFERSTEFLAKASAPALEALRSGELALSDLGLIESAAEAERSLRETLEPAVVAKIEGHLSSSASPVHRAHMLLAYGRTINEYQERFGDPRYATFVALKTGAEKLLASGALGPAAATAARDQEPIVAQHNWTETSGTRAILVLHQPDPSVEFGILKAPIVLETKEPRHSELRLTIDVKGEHRVGWPKDWPDPEPKEPLVIPVYGWQAQDSQEGGKYQYPITLTVPIRRPRVEHPRLEVEVTAVDPATSRTLGNPALLKWDTISLRPIAVSSHFAGATNPDYVRTHPVGPQGRAPDILALLEAGSSVAVIAPRRFGKSTLVEYLLGAGTTDGMLIPPAIVCTEYAVAGGFDYERLWRDVSEHLQQLLGSGLPRNWSSELPNKDSFDDARRAAKQRGQKCIVLLFDEAQLFFPVGRGPDIGTRLKNLLERHWSRGDDKAKVPVLIGLIGLPTLLERAGADVMGLMAPMTETAFREADLRHLITGMTAHLQTTRAARMRLASTAGNLFVLRVLLERLVNRVRDDHRVWANVVDVMAVEEELKRELQAGREEAVAAYIRDALNGAEKVTDWEPIASYPVAAALAQAGVQGRGPREAAVRVVEILNKWCELNSADDTIRPVFDQELTEKHLSDLHDRRVLSNGAFASPLLDAWLQGIAHRGPYDSHFQEALLRAAQRRIRLPVTAERVAEGGQAVIYRASDVSKGRIAYRVRQLTSKTDEDHFRASLEMLEALRGGVLRREPGSDSLCEVIDVGLGAHGNREAILMYRWIDGEDLSSREGRLNADSAVDLGTKLARAVRLIHSRGILHRDIRPKNIVLDEEFMRPVLIDFGFARRIGPPLHTAVSGGQFVAPEARGDRPVWTKAADVYSLAATLRSLLNPPGAADADLGTVLSRAMAEHPEQRSSAEALLSDLEGLEVNRALEAKRQEAWNQVRRAMDADRHKPWLSSVINKFRPTFEGSALGQLSSPMHRYREIANLVNQLLEACPGPRRLSLRNLANQHPDCAELAIVCAIRNSGAHSGVPISKEEQDLLRRFESTASNEQHRIVHVAVRQIEKTLEITCLGALVQRLG